MASSRLVVDLDAISANYRALDSMSAAHTHTAATVKANGYGLGALGVSLACYAGGCRTFCVARLEEALDLRAQFNRCDITDTQIIIFEGITHSDASVYTQNRLTAVVNQLSELELIQSWGDKAPPFLVHIDTAMSRLGFPADEAEHILPALSTMDNYLGVMSHLACADMPDNAINARQLEQFRAITTQISNDQKIFSLANSGGIFLGAEYHFNLTRPGIALSGTAIDDRQLGAEMLTPACRWVTDILQIRTIQAGESVGYGADFTAEKQMHIATLGVGYADGYPRQLSAPNDHRARIEIAGVMCPLIGRISMDTLVADISAIPVSQHAELTTATLVGAHYSISDMAGDCNTIGYEILTTLGARTYRQYNSTDTVLMDRLKKGEC